jgi:chemotaxis-related protein WspD
MRLPAASSPDPVRGVIVDCWNSIGVRGDSSCPELDRHIHCRNCPVYSRAAVDLLDVPPPEGYLAHWTQRVAEVRGAAQRDTHSVLVFRCSSEWLALPMMVLKEIANPRAIHAMPHRRDGAFLGLANIRGQLMACFSLPQVLALGQSAERGPQDRRATGIRFLVIQREGSLAVCPVDEVHGVHRFRPPDLAPLPASVARASAGYTKGLLSWQAKPVGLLDDELLFHTFNRSLA